MDREDQAAEPLANLDGREISGAFSEDQLAVAIRERLGIDPKPSADLSS